MRLNSILCFVTLWPLCKIFLAAPGTDPEPFIVYLVSDTAGQIFFPVRLFSEIGGATLEGTGSKY